MSAGPPNAPAFDPLTCTGADAEDMMRGYLDGQAGCSPPRITTYAYDYGHGVGTNDRLGVSEKEQRDLARRSREGKAA